VSNEIFYLKEIILIENSADRIIAFYRYCQVMFIKVSMNSKPAELKFFKKKDDDNCGKTKRRATNMKPWKPVEMTLCSRF